MREITDEEIRAQERDQEKYGDPPPGLGESNTAIKLYTNAEGKLQLYWYDAHSGDLLMSFKDTPDIMYVYNKLKGFTDVSKGS